MQQTVVAVKSQQKRTDHALASGVTKATYNTISCADLFYLHRSGAFARSVWSVQAFRDDAVKIAARFPKPIARNLVISRCRRKVVCSLLIADSNARIFPDAADARADSASNMSSRSPQADRTRYKLPGELRPVSERDWRRDANAIAIRRTKVRRQSESPVRRRE